MHCFCDIGRHQVARARVDDFSLVRPYVAAVSERRTNSKDQARPPVSSEPPPALRVLFSILEQRTVYGVVVPSIFHLATERQAALALMEQIERLGAKVMVVPANDHATLADLDVDNRALLDALTEPDGPGSCHLWNGN
jgi:hypothetical protein